jgi:hypothetical protein
MPWWGIADESEPRRMRAEIRSIGVDHYLAVSLNSASWLTHRSAPAAQAIGREDLKLHKRPGASSPDSDLAGVSGIVGSWVLDHLSLS